MSWGGDGLGGEWGGGVGDGSELGLGLGIGLLLLSLLSLALSFSCLATNMAYKLFRMLCL